MRNALSAFVVCFAAMLYASCAKVGPAGANGLTGPSGPSYTNAYIMGHVKLYDQFGNPLLLGLKGVAVTLNGGTTIYPDTYGFYQFTGVATGAYSIMASDSSYAATMVPDFQLILDTVYKDICLSAIPTFNPVSITAAKSVALPLASDSVVVTFPADSRNRGCILFVNAVDSATNAIPNYQAAYPQTFNGTTATFILSAGQLYNLGLTSGAMLYMAAYSYPVKDYSVYEDPGTGKNVYNAVGTTKVVDSVLVP